MKSAAWYKKWTLWAQCLLLLPLPLLAGTLSGQGVFREKLALPPQATLSVVLVEYTADGGVGTAVAQTQLPATGPATSFTLAYDDAAILRPRRYVLRASIEADGQVLLHTARDRVFNPKKPPARVELLMTSGLRGAPATKSTIPAAPFVDALPASYAGELPGAGGAVQWQLNLLPGGAYELRRSYAGRPQPNDFDDRGHWLWNQAKSQLMLTSSRNVRVRFERLDDQHLRQLDQRGRVIASDVNHTLQRQAVFALLPVALRGPDWRLVHMEGFDLAGQAGKVLPHFVLNRKTNQLVGDGGCNRLKGTFTMKADQLSLAPVASTRRTCERGAELEQRFLTMLAQVRSYAIDASGLQLRDADGRVLAQLEARAKAP